MSTLRPRRRLRAPLEDGAAFIDPPLGEAAKLIEYNRAVTAPLDGLADFPANFRKRARAGLAAMELDHLRHTAPMGPLVLSGHQPELFHPGVWLKNFVISETAKAVGGIAVNLVIDSDAARSTSVRVPTRIDGAPAVIAVPFDDPDQDLPWEMRLIKSRSTFQDFAERTAEAYAPVRGGDNRRLLLEEFWPLVRAAADRQADGIKDMLKHADMGLIRSMVGPVDLQDVFARLSLLFPRDLGASLSAGRHALEQSLGLTTHEIPISLLGRHFQLFADHLLRRHREFREIHNAVVAQFRMLHGIRGRQHPVPDLAQDGDWIESPLWMWSRSNTRRRRVFVRPFGPTIQITDRGGVVEVVSRGDPGHEFDSRSVLRPRALITTMYARLVLSDLFIHGIGGAKYDEVTDEIIRRFFGIEPPKYITATATFRLPIERPQVTIEDVREARQKLRDVRYRPETFLRDPLTKSVAGLREELQALADEKREYVRTHDLRRCEEQVFARLNMINRAMHELLAPVERELHAQQARLNEDLRRADLLGSREFSFVLFPADELPARLLALSKVSA